MKRLLVLLLAFLLLLAAASALGEDRREGPGASSPQALAQAYVQALNSGDAQSVLRLFAMESYVDRKRPDLYASPASFADSMICPATDPYTRELLICEHYAEIADDWFHIWLYWCNPAQYTSRMTLGISKNGKNGESPEAYLADMKSSAAARLPGHIALLHFEDDAHALMSALYPDMDTSLVKARIDALQRMWGCDEARSMGLVLRLGDDTVFTAPVIARYGDAWYLMDFSSDYTRMQSEHPFIPARWDGPAEAADASAIESSALQGDGFASPQDAALAYAAAWRQGDTQAMLRCFAVESMVDHFNVETYLSSLSMISIHADPAKAVPPADGLARSSMIAVRLGTLSERMMLGHLWEGGWTNHTSADSHLKPEMVQRAWANFTGDDLTGMTFGAPITGDCPELRALLGDDRTDTLMDHESRAYEKGYLRSVNPELLGCEELAEVWLPLTLKGDSCLLTLTCARYGGRWYIYSLSGYLIDVMRDYSPNFYWGLLHLSNSAQ